MKHVTPLRNSSVAANSALTCTSSSDIAPSYGNMRLNRKSRVPTSSASPRASWNEECR